LTLSYLPKPFHIREFWAALNELVGPSDYPEMQALVEPLVVA
jgi:DNA-binding response OmpR family regulator